MFSRGKRWNTIFIQVTPRLVIRTHVHQYLFFWFMHLYLSESLRSLSVVYSEVLSYSTWDTVEVTTEWCRWVFDLYLGSWESVNDRDLLNRRLSMFFLLSTGKGDVEHRRENYKVTVFTGQSFILSNDEILEGTECWFTCVFVFPIRFHKV